jgi:hypothetical protein
MGEWRATVDDLENPVSLPLNIVFCYILFDDLFAILKMHPEHRFS